MHESGAPDIGAPDGLFAILLRYPVEHDADGAPVGGGRRVLAQYLEHELRRGDPVCGLGVAAREYLPERVERRVGYGDEPPLHARPARFRGSGYFDESKLFLFFDDIISFRGKPPL